MQLLRQGLRYGRRKRALKAARAKDNDVVLDPFRLLLVIREWLGLRDLVRDAGTYPLCRAVV